ncbi:MAG: polyhydroxybutyrate depolymerase [Pseudomonadota bacterium]
MRFIGALIFGLLTGQSALACGADTDCMIGERHYRIAMPDGHADGEQIPAILFAHGYKGSAANVMKNGSLRGLATDLGAALIAVKSDGPGWEVPNNPRDPGTDGAAEFAYFDAVLADAVDRFDIDAARVMATGFSSGGMMIWNLACARPGDYAGFAPVAGTFWLKPPAACAQPATNIIHIHGDADKTVPLLGRVIGPTKQGEVPAALKMYSDTGDFGPAQSAQYEGLACEEQTNPSGAMLEFCMFSGGHSFRTEHVRHAWDRLTTAGKL